MTGDPLAELKQLNQLAQEQDSDRRRQLLLRTTDLFFDRSETFNEIQSRYFGDIIETLAFELESKVRAELARRLAPKAQAPRSLLSRLAADDIAVARPVLEHSAALTQDDLICIGEKGSQDHLLAFRGSRRDFDLAARYYV